MELGIQVIQEKIDRYYQMYSTAKELNKENPSQAYEMAINDSRNQIERLQQAQNELVDSMQLYDHIKSLESKQPPLYMKSA